MNPPSRIATIERRSDDVGDTARHRREGRDRATDPARPEGIVEIDWRRLAPD
jgi:hypothetical protein